MQSTDRMLTTDHRHRLQVRAVQGGRRAVLQSGVLFHLQRHGAGHQGRDHGRAATATTSSSTKSASGLLAP